MTPKIKEYVNVKTLLGGLALAGILGIGSSCINKINEVQDTVNTTKQFIPQFKTVQQNVLLNTEKLNQQNVINAVTQQNFNDLKEALKELREDVKQVIRQTK